MPMPAAGCATLVQPPRAWSKYSTVPAGIPVGPGAQLQWSSTTAASSECEFNPADAPITTVEPYQWVPEVGRISVTMSGLPSGTVTPGDLS